MSFEYKNIELFKDYPERIGFKLCTHLGEISWAGHGQFFLSTSYDFLFIYYHFLLFKNNCWSSSQNFDNIWIKLTELLKIK